VAELAVETIGLNKTFGSLEAVRSLNLSVVRGEMYALVGPDGAGKTTIIRMLCGILKPTSGRARVLEFDLEEEAEDLKFHIGYLSQKFSLYGDLTIDENIEFFAEIHRVSGFRKRRDELLEFTRLTPFRNRQADKLSGGMRQKLALVCTLIHTPRILFLDEPTTGVDPVSRRDFWKILSNLLRSGITIVMTTPYMDEAERCSRIGFISEGRLLAAGPPADIKKLMDGTVIEIVCPEIQKAFSVLRKKPVALEIQIFGDRLNIVVRDPETEIPAIESELMKAGISIVQQRVLAPSLENVFISVVQRARAEAVRV
jgi:ABC-2 type transport system ATP-binding protein